MSKRKKGTKRGGKPKRTTSVPLLGKLKNGWQQISPVAKFVLAFGLCFGLFYAVYLSDFYAQHIGPPLTSLQAHIGGVLLDLLGQQTTVADSRISGSDYSVNIKKGCDGLEPMAMLLCAILVFPIAFRFKWRGILLGSLVLLVLNQVRIVALYFAGKSFSEELFEWLHLQGGFVIFTAFVVIIWMTWANWAMKAEQQTITNP